MTVTTRASFIALLLTLVCAIVATLSIKMIGSLAIILILGFCTAGSIVAFKLLNESYVQRGEEILFQYKKTSNKKNNSRIIANRKVKL